MAIHEIQAPDGSVHEIEAPDNASPEQVLSFFQQSLSQGGQAAPQDNQQQLQQVFESKRQQAVDDVVNRVNAGQQSKTGGALAIYGQGLGQQADDIGAFVGRHTPDFIKKGLDYAANQASDLGTTVGENLPDGVSNAVAGTANAISGGIDSLNQNYPVTMSELAGLGNIAKTIVAAAPAVRTVEGAIPLAQDAAALAVRPAKVIGEGIKNRVGGLKALGADELKTLVKDQGNQVTNAYREVDKTGTVVGKTSADNLMSKIDDKLAETDLDPEFQPKTIAALRVLKKNIESTANGEGQVSLGKLDQFRRLLGRAKAPEDRLVANDLRTALDEHLNDISEGDLVGGSADSIAKLNQARATAAKSFAVEKIAKIIQKAGGDNNAIRKGFTKFLEDDSNLRGLNEDEISAFKNAATNTKGQAIEKFLGRFGIDGKGGVLPVSLSAAKVGGAPFIPGGIPAVGVGTVAKYTGKLAARNDAQGALNAVVNRPIADELQKAFIRAKAKGMRERIETSRSSPSLLPDPLLLPAPESVFKGSLGGPVTPGYFTNAERVASDNMNNLGLTSDVIKSQTVNLTNKAYEEKAILEQLQKEFELRKIEEASQPIKDQMLSKALSKKTKQDIRNLLSRRNNAL